MAVIRTYNQPLQKSDVVLTMTCWTAEILVEFLFLEVEDDISISSSSEETISALPEMLDFLG